MNREAELSLSAPKLTHVNFPQSTQNEQMWTYAQYLYDALGYRVRLKEMGTYMNKSFTYDALLLYREVTKAATRSSRVFVCLFVCFNRSDVKDYEGRYLGRSTEIFIGRLLHQEHG